MSIARANRRQNTKASVQTRVAELERSSYELEQKALMSEMYTQELIKVISSLEDIIKDKLGMSSEDIEELLKANKEVSDAAEIDAIIEEEFNEPTIEPLGFDEEPEEDYIIPLELEAPKEKSAKKKTVRKTKKK